MDNVYSLGQIKDHWKDYQEQSWYRVLKDGKWLVRKLPPEAGETVTKCEMLPPSKMISFPKYLEMLGA